MHICTWQDVNTGIFIHNNSVYVAKKSLCCHSSTAVFVPVNNCCCRRCLQQHSSSVTAAVTSSGRAARTTASRRAATARAIQRSYHETIPINTAVRSYHVTRLYQSIPLLLVFQTKNKKNREETRLESLASGCVVSPRTRKSIYVYVIRTAVYIQQHNM